MSELKRGLFPQRKRSQNVDQTHASIAADTNGSEVPAKGKKFGRKNRTKRKKKKKRRLTLAVLPTMLTLGNGVCGMAAIAIAISTNLNWQPETQMFVAGLLIFGGMLFDALDGSAARMTGQESEFGAELDSLCDAVTFGTAPAVLLWQMSQKILQPSAWGIPPQLIWGVGVLFTLCVLIRLARFNVETGEDDTHEGFEGLPSPAAAGTLASVAIMYPELNALATGDSPEVIQWIAQQLLAASHFFVPALALALAYLMVSRYQYPHVFQRLVRRRRSLHQIGQALFIVFGCVLFYWIALPVLLGYFAFESPVRSLVMGQAPGTQKKSVDDESPTKDRQQDAKTVDVESPEQQT